MSTQVAYKCHCMDKEEILQVPSRDRDEDLGFWMNNVLQMSIYLDHRKRAPSCKADKMEYAKIMLPENCEFVGQADKH